MSWTDTRPFKDSWKESPSHVEWDPNEDRDTILVKNAISRSQEYHILLSLSPLDLYFGPEARYKPEAEPPPHLDYWSLNMMIRLCAPHVERKDRKKFLKRWEYLAQSRSGYFAVHDRFFQAFNKLSDTRAFDKIMKEKCETMSERFKIMEKSGIAVAILNQKKRELEDTRLQFEKNRGKSIQYLKAVQDLAKKRDEAAAWLSQSKLNMVNGDLKHLVDNARRIMKKYKVGTLEQALEKACTSSDHGNGRSESPITVGHSRNDEMDTS